MSTKTAKNASLVADLTSFTDEQLAAELSKREEARVRALEEEQNERMKKQNQLRVQIEQDINALVDKGMECINAAMDLSKEHNVPFSISLDGRSMTFDGHNESSESLWTSSSDNC